MFTITVNIRDNKDRRVTEIPDHDPRTKILSGPFFVLREEAKEYLKLWNLADVETDPVKLDSLRKQMRILEA